MLLTSMSSPAEMKMLPTTPTAPCNKTSCVAVMVNSLSYVIALAWLLRTTPETSTVLPDKTMLLPDSSQPEVCATVTEPVVEATCNKPRVELPIVLSISTSFKPVSTIRPPASSVLKWLVP